MIEKIVFFYFYMVIKIWMMFNILYLLNYILFIFGIRLIWKILNLILLILFFRINIFY